MANDSHFKPQFTWYPYYPIYLRILSAQIKLLNKTGNLEVLWIVLSRI